MHGCLLPALFAALQSGDIPPIVPDLGALDEVAPPTAHKGVLGAYRDHWIHTDNFTVQWDGSDVTQDEAEQIAADMELAWSGLVDDAGWGVPTSGEDYLIRVVLDETLEATGVTVTTPHDDWPAGVPVIYINTLYTDLPQFMASLCAHEFGHALQFRVRDWYAGGAEEAWYWEASSEWMAEIARPDADAYALAAAFYASSTELAYHNRFDSHPYGMFLLNAFLEEYRVGRDGFRDIWLDNRGGPWLTEIANATGEEVRWTWAGFTGAYGAGALRESDLYEPPLEAASPGIIDGLLGTEYANLGLVDGTLHLSAGVGAIIRDGSWVPFEGEVDIPEGEEEVWLAVTNPDEAPLRYTWALGTTAPWADTGGPDSGLLDEEEEEDESPKGCGCSAGPQERSMWIWLSALALVLGRRVYRPTRVTRRIPTTVTP
jgi:MYXO-CTERM domain-containing protein